MTNFIVKDLAELKTYFEELVIEDIDRALVELTSVLSKKNKQQTVNLFKSTINSIRENEIVDTDEQHQKKKLRLNKSVLGFINDLKERDIKTEIFEQEKIEPITNTIENKIVKDTKPLVALLVFPNDDSLKNLDKEEAEIQLALQHFKEAGGNIEMIVLSSVDELFKYFDLYKGRIGLIHYGGHASGKGLLIDNQRANANGLANLMGLEPNLQFVFLNGCATKPQVELLQKNNVRVILATSSPINDGKATNFAIRFYQNFTFFNNQNTLQDAFNHAKSYIETTETTPITISTRGFVFDNEEMISPFQWALYTHPDFENAINWKLPRKGINITQTVAIRTKSITFVPPVVEQLSDIERTSLEQQQKTLEQKIAFYENKILKGGLSMNQEFSSTNEIEEMTAKLAVIRKKLGL